MTLLSFKSWDLRKSVLEKWGGNIGMISVVNAHPDHNATSQLRILWKTLTIMEPAFDNDWHPDLKAWARVHYYSENGEFKGRLSKGRLRSWTPSRRS